MNAHPNINASESDTQPTTQQDAESTQQAAENSQTASDYIDSQLKLEADAREALPYSFDQCTQPLGALKQSVYSCLTCNPPPPSQSEYYDPAGICYACSISCHGEHTLVEIFERRNFVCDCGTTRFSAASPCTLRINPDTGTKGPVHSQESAKENDYNKNFRNRFCGCGEWYEAEKQKGTMFQCLGLATEAQGGCGEDWWHPECLLGLPRDWYASKAEKDAEQKPSEAPQSENSANKEQEEQEEEHPVPPGFPNEDDFDTLLCYKCVEATPWIKAYAGSAGFKALKYTKSDGFSRENIIKRTNDIVFQSNASVDTVSVSEEASKKRKAEDDVGGESPKKAKVEDVDEIPESLPKPLHAMLPPAPEGSFSIVTTEEEYRDRFCRCAECYPKLSKLPQLLEEEETYKPPISEDGDGQGGSVGTGSLLDRGEAALSNVDRVRAIEGVMVYNHLRDKVKDFLAPFAESGKAVGAEDIKAYFEKLRGDEAAIRAAGAAVTGGDGSGGSGNNRREQSGY